MPSSAVLRRPPPLPSLSPATDPAMALLVAAARAAVARAGERAEPLAAPSGDGERDIAAALATAETEPLVGLAARHGMTSLLHRFLADRGDVPRAIGDAVRAAHGAAARRALAMAGELVRVCERLDAAGIVALAYKGPALAVQAYGDLALRSPSDLDVLVVPEEAPRALALLAEAGYLPGYATTPARDRCFRAVDGDYPLRGDATGTLVELHCRASSRRFGVRLETRALARRAVDVRLGGATVPAPAPDDLLLALCVHGCKHRWPRLEWLAAMAALARRPEAALATLPERAAARGGRRMALLGVTLAHEVLGLPLPPDVAAAAREDGAVGALAGEARAVLFAAEEPEGETAANLAFNLRAQDGIAARGRYAWRWATLPSPEDWAAADLPDALFPLYRLLRPLRLARQYGGARRPEAT